MGYRILADGVVLLHGAFVVFVVFGGFLVLYRRLFLGIHLPAAVWGFLIELRGWICPLTYLENHLRQKAGTAGYPGGFVEHYLIPVLYPAALTVNVQLFLAGGVVVVNVMVYGLVVRKLWQARRRG